MEVNVETVRELIATQAPQFAHLPLAPVRSGGTDNTIVRLGERLCVRLPKRSDAVSQIEKERDWLPRLAPLPLKIPVPVFIGAPDDCFAHPWAIYEWIEGAPLSEATVTDWFAAAEMMSRFLRGLQRKTISGAPRSGKQNHYRGVALIGRDALTRQAIAGLEDLYPARKLLNIWEHALAAGEHTGAATWLHGDLQGGNILVADGELTAVIDFGLSGVGDPACDLMVAWSVLPKHVREAFHQQMACDEGAVLRGMGWALSVSVIALDYYRTRNPALSKISRQTIDAVIGQD